MTNCTCGRKLHSATEGSRHFLMCTFCETEVPLVPQEPVMAPVVERAWQHDHEQPVFKSEEAFLQAVKRLARECGWDRVYHTRRSKGSDAGWPDIVIARPGRIIFAELKMPKGQPTPDQQEWLRLLKEAGKEVYLWYPKDWPQIERVLEGRRLE